jgi:hypothetical protein
MEITLISYWIYSIAEPGKVVKMTRKMECIQTAQTVVP